jgi:hypothetical protein
MPSCCRHCVIRPKSTLLSTAPPQSSVCSVQARSSRDSNTSAESLTLPAPPQPKAGPSSQGAPQYVSTDASRHRADSAASQRHAASALHTSQSARCRASGSVAPAASMRSGSVDRDTEGGSAQQAKARSCRPPPPPPPLPAQVSRPNPRAAAEVVRGSTQPSHSNPQGACLQGDQGCLTLGARLSILPRILPTGPGSRDLSGRRRDVHLWRKAHLRDAFTSRLCRSHNAS